MQSLVTATAWLGRFTAALRSPAGGGLRGIRSPKDQAGLGWLHVIFSRTLRDLQSWWVPSEAGQRNSSFA